MSWRDGTLSGASVGVEHEARPVFLGVCLILARRLSVAPVWLRTAFVILTLATPLTVVVYVALRLLLPDPSTIGLPLSERLREEGRRVGDQLRGLRAEFFARFEMWRYQRESADPALRWRAILGAALFGAGGLLLLSSFGLLGWLTFGRTLAALLVIAGIALLRPAH
jgi:phage shock protein PspC (stress-responsive transcriptional regulator)